MTTADERRIAPEGVSPSAGRGDRPAACGHRPPSTADTPLTAATSLHHAAASVLAPQLDRLQANEAGAIEGHDPEYVHEMRVATRTLREALRVFAEAMETADIEATTDEVRWLAALLGGVRDLDVFLEWLNRYRESAPGGDRAAITEYIDETSTKQQDARALLIDGLRSQRYLDLKQALARLVHELESSQGSREDLASQARQAIVSRHRRLCRAARKARSGRPEDLHRLRIQCKRLRYTCEFFADLYQDGLQSVIKACRAMQDCLGAARDARLHRDELRGRGPAKAWVRMRRALKRREKAQLERFCAVSPRLVGPKSKRRLARALRRSCS